MTTPEAGLDAAGDDSRHCRQLVDELRAKAEFSALVAHELALPLAAIRAWTDCLAEDDLAAAERSLALESIRAETDRLFALADDVRLMGEHLHPDFQVNARPVPLDDVLAEAASYARLLSSSHPMAWPDPTGLVALADPVRVGQVLRNLLENAFKHTPPDTPIRIRAGRATSDDGRVRVEVEDRGPGIPSDAVDAVFERRRRVGRWDGQAVPGSGLGLFLARRIVRDHGDGLDLTLRETPGGGATFAFDLRVAAAEPSPAPPRPVGTWGGPAGGPL